MHLERFLSRHTMRILMDEGVFRHLVFSVGRSCVDKFEITTWPDYLCISGDRGCFVFRRTYDMFNFFSIPAGSISPGYWSDKLQAVDRCDGYRQFDLEAYLSAIEHDFGEWEFESTEEKERIWEDINTSIIGRVDEETSVEEAFSTVLCYRSASGKHFVDFRENDLYKYTHNYVWCLKAIAAGVRRYWNGGVSNRPAWVTG